jgi:hypothetical protein
MKAQRRQELKTNELAETLRQVREFLEKYGTYVAAGVLVVAAILVAFLWHRSSHLAEHRRQWEDYYNLERDAVQLVMASLQGTAPAGTDAFDGLVSRYKARASSASDPRVRLLLLEGLGDFCWAYAVNGLGKEPDAAAKTRALDEGANAYEQITREFPDDEWSVGKALMALGVIDEERHDFDQAEERYRRVITDPASEGTSLNDLAQEALGRLNELRQPVVFAPPPPPPAPEKPQAPAVPGLQPEPAVTTRAAAPETAPVAAQEWPDEEGPSSPAEPLEEGTGAARGSDEGGGAEEPVVSPSAPSEAASRPADETSSSGATPAKPPDSTGADESGTTEKGQPGTRSE